MLNIKPHVQKSSEVAEHIDPNKRVRVYRNLHKNCFSVKQDGLVRCHADHVTLEDCKFIVSKAGQERVRDEGRKNVMRLLRACWLILVRPTPLLTVRSLMPKWMRARVTGRKPTTTPIHLWHIHQPVRRITTRDSEVCWSLRWPNHNQHLLLGEL